MTACRLTLVRDAEWIGADRARGYRLLLAIVTCTAAGGMILLSRHGIDPAGKPLGTDFLAFWSAARLALAGAPAAAWDVVQLGTYERGAMPVDPGVACFLYPPPYLLLCLPFGLLPYFGALPLWLTLTGSAYVAAIRPWLVRHGGIFLTIAAFPAVMVNVGHGQNGLLTAALLGGGLWQLKRRPWLAGAMLGALIIKPQLTLALPVLIIAGNHKRAMIGALASASLLCLAATVAFGSSIWGAFMAGAPLGRAILERGLVEPEKMVSIFAALRVAGIPLALAYAAQAFTALASMLLLIRVARAPNASPEGVAALAASATLMMSPFVLDYDCAVAAIPLAWLFSEGVRRGFWPWEKIILVLAYLLPLLSRPIALTTGIPIAPIVLAALLLSVARAAAPRRAAFDASSALSGGPESGAPAIT